MIKLFFHAIFGCLLLGTACQRKIQPDDPTVWQKVKIDFKKLDAEGLSGTPKGKVAVNYEFCIPAEAENWEEVHKIDPSAQKQKGRGRVGCGADEWLVIGSTHQKNYKKILYDLAKLPYVQRIEETFWE